MQPVNSQIRENVAQIEDEIRKEYSEGDGKRLNKLYGQILNQAFIMQTGLAEQFVN